MWECCGSVVEVKARMFEVKVSVEVRVWECCGSVVEVKAWVFEVKVSVEEL